MGSRLKKLVRARQAKTGEAYSTALMRVKECVGGYVLTGDAEKDAAESIRVSPPRLGAGLPVKP